MALWPSGISRVTRRLNVARAIADQRVSVKILLAVGLVSVIGATSGGLAVFNMASVNQNTSTIYDQNQQLEKITEMRDGVSRVRIEFSEHLLTVDPDAKRNTEEVLNKNVKLVADAEAAYKRFDLGSERRELLADFDQAWSRYLDLMRNKVLPLSREGKASETEWIRSSEMAPSVAAIRIALETLVTKTEEIAASERADAQGYFNISLIRTISLVLLGLVAGIAGAIWIGRMVTRPLATCVRALNRIREGDLTARANVAGSDEVGQLAVALDASVEAMSTMVRQVAENAHQVAEASEQLSSVSTQMSSVAEETAAQAGGVSAAATQVSENVRNAASGTEEMGSSIAYIANSASEAAKIAAEAAGAASKTNEMVSRLGRSSKEISGVVQLITTIAEQTNLLALNATIEAARAGESGKGFAVVAAEVKDLAQATARATGDIESQISAIQQDAEQAVRAIGEIGAVTNQINDYAAAIATAVEQQTSATAEIARGVAEAATGAGAIATTTTGVAQAAGITASGATETQNTAQDLARMAAELRKTVAAYQI